MFAARKIKQGEVFERAPVVVIPRDQWRLAEKTVIDDYAFEWGRDLKDAAIVLGYGSLYNHSATPNARFEYRLTEKLYVFIALRDIEPGEEILTNYNGDPEDQTALWFEGAKQNGR